MNSKVLSSVLLLIILSVVLIFIVFAITANFMRFMNFVIKIDNLLKETNTKDDEDFFINKKANYKTAEELGYKNYLYDINGTEWGEGMNILLVGSDKRFYQDKKARSDVIIVLRIISSGKIMSISIPRDTLITLKDGDWKGCKDKIGHSLYWEDLENLKKNVEDILNSPVYRVAIIDNFKSFEIFSELIGNVDIRDYKDSSDSISWIRSRNFKEGDIERCKRQQLFLKKASVKLWDRTKHGNYIYSGMIYDILTKVIYTDLKKDEFYEILYLLRKNNFNPVNDFYTGIVPGTFSRYDSVLLKRKNVDCWIPDEYIVRKIQFIFYTESNYKNYLEKVSYFNFLKLDFINYYDNMHNHNLIKK